MRACPAGTRNAACAPPAPPQDGSGHGRALPGSAVQPHRLHIRSKQVTSLTVNASHAAEQLAPLNGGSGHGRTLPGSAVQPHNPYRRAVCIAGRLPWALSDGRWEYGAGCPCLRMIGGRRRAGRRLICDDRAFGRLRRMKLRCVDMDARRVKSPRYCVGAHRLKGHAPGEITVVPRKGAHRMESPRHCVGAHRLKPLRHAWTAVASTQHLTCCQPQKGAYFAEAGL